MVEGVGTVTRIAVVDDHEIIRLGLSVAIRSEADLELAGAYESVEEYASRVIVQPDVVVLDLGLGGLRGTEAVGYLCEQDIPVLVVSATGTRQTVLATIAAGATGYLTKQSGTGEILAAARLVAAGGCHVSPTLAAFLRNHLREVAEGDGDPADALTAEEDDILTALARGETMAAVARRMGLGSALGLGPRLGEVFTKTARTHGGRVPLSDREREVLLLVVRGLTNEAIGERLDISVKTVRTYLDRIRVKTGCRKQTELTRFAYESGLVVAGMDAVGD